MSGAVRNKKQVRAPREVRARVEVNVCGEEPEKAWNDLWVRILTDFAIADASEGDTTPQYEADAATSGAGREVGRGKMERG